MSKNLKIIIIAAIILIVTVIAIGVTVKPKNNKKNGKLSIVTTTFSTYDFAKQIVGDKAEVIDLLGPGVDAHSYEPSARDLIKIQSADVFIYVGGEMEQWVDKVLNSDTINKNATSVIQVTESVETIEEQEVDGAEEDDEHHHDEHDEIDGEEAEHEEHKEIGAFDEHIWTSPKNAKKMIEYMCDKFSKIDTKNEEKYKENAKKYIEKIEDVESKIQEIVDNKKRDRLVFGDKMPMQYFLNQFGLTASAAFNGCSTETEPSAKTITYLANKVKEEKIPVVLYIELSTGKTAKSIAAETGTETMQIQTLHNISKTDFENGENYVSLMQRNLEVLKKALQ